MGVHFLEAIVPYAQLVANLQLVEGTRRQISGEIAVCNYHLFYGELFKGLSKCSEMWLAKL